MAGFNAQGIASGVVATVHITLAPAAGAFSIGLLNLIAVDSSGSSLRMSATGAAMINVPVISTFSCTPASLSPGGNASCSIGLSSAAPAGGVPVQLTSSTPWFAVPSSVRIPAGSVAGSFNAAVQNSATINQTATITATCGGSAKSTVVNVGTGTMPVGLVAMPSSLLFEVTAGHTASQVVALTGEPADTGLAVMPTTANGGNWLSGTSPSGPANHMTLSVSVDPAGLTAGVYTGSLAVSASGGASASVAVTMNVSAAGQLIAWPPTLNFTWDPNNAEIPQARGITVVSNPSGADFAAVADPASESWLSVQSTGSNDTPGFFSVSVNGGQLVPGVYSGHITITSSVNDPVQIPVTLSVTGGPPKLSVPGLSQTFAAVQGGGPVNGEVVVTNAGGGILHFAAQVAAGTGNWLTLDSGRAGSATISAPASFGFTLHPAALDAGIYTGQITIQDTDSQALSTVTIIMAVSTAPELIAVSQRGLVFSAVEGGPAPPNQTFTLATRGAGPQELSIETQLLANAQGLQNNWLNFTYSGGPDVTVSVDQSGLPAGQYFGSIVIGDTSAVNSPATVSIMLNVQPPAPTGPEIQLATGSLVFTGQAGSQTLQQQQISVFNPLSKIVTWSASIYSLPAGWITTSPNGTLLPGANTVDVQVAFSVLSPGVQEATLSVAFSDGTVSTVQIEAIAIPQLSSTTTNTVPPLSSPHGRLSHPKAQAGICSGGNPDLLVSLFQAPLDGATLQAGVAQTVRVQTVDNCGNSLAEANGDAVQVLFDDGDGPLTLHDTGGGIWEATWVPQASATHATLQAVPFGHGTGELILTGTSISTAVQRGPSEIPRISGVVNAALASQAPLNILAPGSYIALYGSGLSTDNVSASATPLPTTLGGSQLLLGGTPMPLVYASPTQLNAVVPQGVSLNTEYDLLIVQGFTQSVPVPVVLTGLQPGIYSIDSSGSGQGIAEIAGTALLAAPLSSVSRPVERGVESVSVYCTGLGPVAGGKGEMPPGDGEAAPGNVIYQTTEMMTATIGGVNAPVKFSGLTPTLVGVYQVNIQVPPGAPTGDAVPLIISAVDPETGGTLQSNAVTIAIQ